MNWYYSRFSAMSFGEIVFRSNRLLSNSLCRWGLRRARSNIETASVAPIPNWISCPDSLNSEYYTSAADRILDGKSAVFALCNGIETSETLWNKDPLTGTVAPLKFGKSLDYRSERIVGNIKYLWEPNRHLESVALAQAYCLSGDMRYIEGLARRISTWIDQCPYLYGPNWSSALELAIRLINWSIVWQLTGGEDSPLFKIENGSALRKKWLRSIFQHQHFIDGYYSQHSSANNHLIGEAAGVYVASATWPAWKETHDWKTRAKSILLDEIHKQTFSDGVNKEQAVSYQQFVADFLLIAGLASEASDDSMPNTYWQTFEKMLEFINALMDVGGNVPMIGDADDGYVTRLSQEPDFCPYSSLLATGAILFGRNSWSEKAGVLDDKTRALTNSRILVNQQHRNSHAGQESETKKDFPEGGYYILGSRLGEDDEMRLIVDAGELGYLSIAAHGHADSLSLLLSIGGHEILVDPGTYSYHTNMLWRNYFRGTSAHNTVVIDEMDQSVSGGNFLWTHHAHTTVEKIKRESDSEVIIAEHDGYTRLDDPVTHKRQVKFTENTVDITDFISCTSYHKVRRCWHFSEDCKVEVRDGQIYASNHGINIRLNTHENGTHISHHRGSDDPPAGWISRAFDERTPTSTIFIDNEIVESSQLRVTIENVT